MWFIHTKIISLSVFAILHLFFTDSVTAQSLTVAGTVHVIEEQGEVPLGGATIRLLVLPDSSMVHGTSTGQMGDFNIRNVEPGDYLLQASYVGFGTVEEQIEVTNRDISELVIRLANIPLELDVIQVTARRPRVDVRGDTTAFHADGYRTNRDASAEELVTRMPGFTIENGRVQAQGEKVRRVLVDGQEFFGDDAAITLRNLPAEIIEDIEVFNRMSDQAQFTGFDDGNTERIINIVTRGGMSNGQFGRANSGLGSETRYTAGGNYNNFDGARRISILGMSNNVNQQNFSSEDLIGISQGGSGGRGGRGRGGRGGPGGGNVRDFMVGGQDGISTAYDISGNILYRHRFETRGRTFSANLGTNFNDQTGQRHQIDESLYYGEDENSIVNDQQTELFTGGRTVSANLSYTEPVGESGQLMFSYRPSVNRNNSVQDAFLFNEETGSYDIPDPLLSNRYDNLVLTHQTRGSYRLRGERYNAEVNLSWQHTTLNGEQVFPEVVETSQSWQNLLPGASFRYRFDSNSNIRFNYNTRTRTPSARQLQDVVDNSNPLRMTTGNPDLDQRLDHRFTLRFRAANGEKGSSTMAFVSAGYTQDHIGNRTFIAQRDTLLQDGIILGRGARLVSPDNLGGSWNIRSFLFRSVPVDLIRSNLNLNGGITYSREPSLIEENRNLTEPPEELPRR